MGHSRDSRNVGREAEAALISSLLLGPDTATHAILLEGEPGIGKTSLWEAASNEAARDGMTVLSSRAGQSEVRLSFAVLGDLLEPLHGRVGGLPPYQREVLDTALLKTASPESPVDARSVGVAALALVRNATADARVVIAIDDAQWIDSSSRRVLEFVFRRLDRGCRVLLTIRTEGEQAGRPTLDAIFGPDRMTVIPLEALTLDDLARMIAARTGAHPPRSVAERLHRLSGGNPFYALELARAAGPGLVELDTTLPKVPANLRQAVETRVGRLSEPARTAAIYVSAMSQPRVATVRAALAEAGVAEDAVEQAIEAGILAIDGPRLRVTHPLYGGALHAALPLRKRLELHRSLARSARDDEERARHLALATVDPDEEIAELLDRAATAAYARGAPDAAAELAERARRLTPPDDVAAIVARAADTAGFLLEAGNATVGEKLLTEALQIAPPGEGRTRCLQTLARFHFFSGTLPESQDIYGQAAVTDDLRLRAASREGLAIVAWLRGMGRDAVAHALGAATDFEGVGDRIGHAEALAEATYFESLLGDGIPTERFQEALALEDHSIHVRILRRPSMWVTLPWLWVDDLDSQSDALRALARRAIDEGDELSTPIVLQSLVEPECRLGRIDAAARYAAEAADAAAPSGRDLALDAVWGARSLVAAITGDIAQARDLISRGIAYSERTDSLISSLRHRSVLTLIEVSLGDHEAAVDASLPLVARTQRAGYLEPWVLRFVPDLAEALIMLGRDREADEILAPYEERARRLQRLTAIAAAKRCRALALMERGGDAAQAESLLKDALDLHARCREAFAGARTMLVLGMLQRRVKRRGDARATLEQARGAFDAMGASLWSERARTEAARVGGRAASPTELTPTEERVAQLAAAGMTNREIAGELFVSPKTVEVNLTRVYRKLGVRSRADLRRRSRLARESEEQT